jgi:hypothetical protein
MTAEAPASSAIFACSTFMTSMMTLPISSTFKKGFQDKPIPIQASQPTTTPASWTGSAV